MEMNDLESSHGCYAAHVLQIGGDEHASQKNTHRI